MLVMAALATAPAQTGPTLASWAGQDADTRRIALGGAVEGVLLATSAVGGLAVPVNTDCFNNQTPEFLDDALVTMSRASPAMPLVQGLLNIEQCSRGKIAR